MLICIPIREKKVSGILQSVKQAEKEGDLLEIWPETAAQFREFREFFLHISIPIIFKVLKIGPNLFEILKTGKIDYLDLDISTSKKIISKIKTEFPKIKIIISFHDFKKTPPDRKLQEITEKMLKNGADIVKIATYARNFQDSLRVLNLLNQLNLKNITAICLAMGNEGQFTRMAGQFLGNYLMYAPIRAADQTAPGQITASELKKIIN